MSFLTDVMLLGASEDDMVWINRAIYERDEQRRQQLERIDFSRAGGTKFFTDEVWAACFNYFTTDHVVDAIESTIKAGKVRRYGLTLFVCDEADEDYGWKVVPIERPA